MITRKNHQKVLSQKGGTCAGYSVANALSYSEEMQGLTIDPYELYENGKKYDSKEGQDYSGTTIKAVIYGAMKDGVPTNDGLKKVYDYHMISSNNTEMILSRLKEQALVASISSTNYFRSFTGRVIEEENFMQKGETPIRHGVAMIGYTYENGQLLWECVNSWGDKWGDGGYFYLPDSLMKKMNEGVFAIDTKEDGWAKRMNKRIENKRKMIQMILGISTVSLIVITMIFFK
jgi:hypothetical protein